MGDPKSKVLATCWLPTDRLAAGGSAGAHVQAPIAGWATGAGNLPCASLLSSVMGEGLIGLPHSLAQGQRPWTRPSREEVGMWGRETHLRFGVCVGCPKNAHLEEEVVPLPTGGPSGGASHV